MSPGEKLNVKAHTVGISNIEVTTGKLVKASASTESEGGRSARAPPNLSFALVKADPQRQSRERKGRQKA